MNIPSYFLLQSATPTPQIPFWQLTQDRIPYVFLLIVAIIAFVIGGIMRPLLEDAANSLQNWVRGWGKAGKFHQKYLTWVIGQYRYLPMQISSDLATQQQYQRPSVDLEELYTPLTLDSSQQPDGREEMSFVRASSYFRRNSKQSMQGIWERLPGWLQNLWQRIRPSQEPTAGAIGEVIWNHPRLVIRGDPGSGKSTLLRYLLLTCARSLRNQHQDEDRRHMVKLRLGWQQRPFPIFIMLNRLADVTQWPENRRLLDAIIDTLPGDLHYPPGFFEKQLQRGNCFIMLDGFDELGNKRARGRMATLISDLVNTYSGTNNHFLISTRIVGYEGQLDHYGFSVRTIQPLEPQEIHTLVQRRYAAIAISDGLNRSEQAKADLRRQYDELARRLLNDLSRNTSLNRLITNPLLLSLIVFVHMADVKLPEQRSLLYSTCVNILVHQWQARKRTDIGLDPPPSLLGLSPANKIALLQDIAMTMQRRPRMEESQAVIGRKEVEAIIAEKLPNFVSHSLPEHLDARQQECEKFATLLLDNIHEESGILVGKGLDKTGEALVSFSHLTFQEYLVADALQQNHTQLPTLLDNLFNPTWREVLLLYVEMADANDVVQSCLNANQQHLFTRYLLAGRCLAEKTNVAAPLRQQVMDCLRAYCCSTKDSNESIQAIIFRIGGESQYDWLIDNLSEQLTGEEKRQLSALKDKKGQNALYGNVQQSLLRIMRESPEVKTRITIGSILSGIGDPRDLDEMIPIPAGPFLMGSTDVDTLSFSDEKPQQLIQLEDFSIGKYPVTNTQYLRFIKATQHRSPRHWQNGEPPPWLLTHPVVNVSWYDAQEYCRWLSATTGQVYRLPTEAEWEKAARGIDGGIYPWGDESPTDLLCNFNNNVGSTTPVGIYQAGVSPYGLYDMAGNVWEWTGSLWGKDVTKPDFGYPYNPQDGREDLTAPNEVHRVVRGGAFSYNLNGVRCAVRYRSGPYVDWSYFGFRVVAPGC